MMSTINEIKKILYKENPDASLGVASKDGLVYLAKTSVGPVLFRVPIAELGEVQWMKTMPAKLLIRYLITVATEIV